MYMKYVHFNHHQHLKKRYFNCNRNMLIQYTNFISSNSMIGLNYWDWVFLALYFFTLIIVNYLISCINSTLYLYIIYQQSYIFYIQSRKDLEKNPANLNFHIKNLLLLLHGQIKKHTKYLFITFFLNITCHHFRTGNIWNFKIHNQYTFYIHQTNKTEYAIMKPKRKNSLRKRFISAKI